LPDYGFSEKPKHVVSSKADVNLVVTDGLYFVFAVHVPQRDVTDKGTTSVVDTASLNNNVSQSKKAASHAGMLVYSMHPCVMQVVRRNAEALQFVGL
jgi:hypothetical protein